MNYEEVDGRAAVVYANYSIGPTLVAAMLGFRDRKLIAETSEILNSRLKIEDVIRLIEFKKIWDKLEKAEGSDVARAWFIGANPWLGEDSPISAIREFRFSAIHNAAQAMIDDSPSF